MTTRHLSSERLSTGRNYRIGHARAEAKKDLRLESASRTASHLVHLLVRSTFERVSGETLDTSLIRRGFFESRESSRTVPDRGLKRAAGE